MGCYRVTRVTPGSAVTINTTVTAVTIGRHLMTKPIASAEFRAAMKRRMTNYPFDRISAYKVRESRDNLQHETNVVGSIAEYLREPRGVYGRSGILVGCTEEDKAYRLKRVPEIIAREVGYNLIHALMALHMEGVSEAAIITFLQSIKPQVDLLIADCNIVEMTTSRSIKTEYGAMKTGSSGVERICSDALLIAEQAVAFCEEHGVI